MDSVLSTMQCITWFNNAFGSQTELVSCPRYLLVYALKHMVDIRPTENDERDQEGMLELADIMKYT